MNISHQTKCSYDLFDKNEPSVCEIMSKFEAVNHVERGQFLTNISISLNHKQLWK